ncbi:cytochrome c6 PetJ [Pantanalinema rosaneae CENA516]|uniref:cytochrome c6 PetJ n=1 Tax=Pantanalinema rosaneae TaxID=1620701 RepID=UPI003D6E6E11
MNTIGFKRIFTFLLLTLAVFSVTFVRPAFADEADTLRLGAKVFGANCAACHLNGNNVVMANKNLKQAALKEYGMDSQQAIVTQVTNGKNAMPAFKGRLSDEEIQAVASYVLAQSERDWKP